MGSTKFTKRNVNRFKKIYPWVQRTPRFALISNKDAILEAAEVSFNDDDEVIYKFVEVYTETPTATAIAKDSAGNDLADVNIFVSSISKTQVTLAASQKFTGSVYVQIVWISSV